MPTAAVASQRQGAEWDRAEEQLSKGVEININALRGYLGLGEIYLQKEDWSSAAEQFRKALLISPDSPVAIQGLQKAKRNL